MIHVTGQLWTSGLKSSHQDSVGSFGDMLGIPKTAVGVSKGARIGDIEYTYVFFWTVFV